MQYLNLDVLTQLSDAAFQHRQPYPWVDIRKTLTAEGFERLRATLPDTSNFHRIAYEKTANSSVGHDRLSLQYQQGVQIGAAWEEFLAELRGPEYGRFVRRMFGAADDQRVIFTFKWYYAWQGCAVAPHCDARHKLGTHIFYFNTDEDWEPSWGGQFLIMDDEGKLNRRLRPDFEKLKITAALDTRGNGSLLFQRTPHSWHGVYPLRSQEGNFRKIFLCTIHLPTWQVWWRGVRGKDPDGYAWSVKAA